MKLVKCWNRLLRDVVVLPSLEIFKTQLNTVLGKLLQLTLLWAEGLDGMSSKGPFQPFFPFHPISSWTQIATS